MTKPTDEPSKTVPAGSAALAALSQFTDTNKEAIDTQQIGYEGSGKNKSDGNPLYLWRAIDILLTTNSRRAREGAPPIEMPLWVADALGLMAGRIVKLSEQARKNRDAKVARNSAIEALGLGGVRGRNPFKSFWTDQKAVGDALTVDFSIMKGNSVSCAIRMIAENKEGRELAKEEIEYFQRDIKRNVARGYNIIGKVSHDVLRNIGGNAVPHGLTNSEAPHEGDGVNRTVRPSRKPRRSK